MAQRRRNDEQPGAVKKGWRYHHIGIPTDKPMPAEEHMPRYGLHKSGFETSMYGVEWMRFDADSPLPELIRMVPHVAFEVDDLDEAISGKDVIWPPGSPSDGVRSAMIVENGAPIELIWFRREG